MDFSIHHLVMMMTLLVAIGLGAAMHKTRFCTTGAISDWINIGHTGRLGAWFFAIAIALGGVLLLEAINVIAIQNKTLGASFPSYRTARFDWLRYLLGGTTLGIGMTLAGGCASRTLVRVGAGSLKSLVVLIVAAIAAYFMMWSNLYQKAFGVWISATTVNFAHWGISSQELAAIIGGIVGRRELSTLHWVLGGLVACSLLLLILRSRDFREDSNNLFGGAAVGLAVAAGWAITGGPLSELWGEYVLQSTEPPIRVAAQSYAFVSPMADMVNFLLNPTRLSLVSFGVMTLIGVVVGSFLHALVAKRFQVEWFTSMRDFVNYAVGGLLIGVGGALATGCSIGQGVTGISTLALGSFLALAAIIFGAALTLKMQYYLLGGKGFLCAFRFASADLKLLPKPKMP